MLFISNEINVKISINRQINKNKDRQINKNKEKK